MFDFIAVPFGKFLYVIYNSLAFKNYGLALIIFTIIVKLALLPLTIKQLRSSSKMQELQPAIQEITKRYKNDKQKQQQELMKLYQEHNYSPMAGCLPLIIQMPILLALYRVIVMPLTFMLGKSKDQVSAIIDTVNNNLANIPGQLGKLNDYYQQLTALKIMNGVDDIEKTFPGITQHLQPSEVINLNFFGINLGDKASYQPNLLFGADTWKTYVPLFLLAVFAVATTFISTKMSMPKVQQQSNTQNPAGCSQNTMMYFAPLMTLFFAFTLPSGMVLYWSAGYVFTIFQQLYINKFVLKKKEVAKK